MGSRRGILAVLVLVVVWLVTAVDPDRINPESGERKWVLVTDFAGAAGDPDLAGALRFAMEQELTASRWLNAASTDRVQDTLARMRKPLNSIIDETTGRELCLRDGGIEALVVGQIEHLGSAYRVGLRLVDPVSNTTLAASTLDAETRDEILEAIRELARWVRSELGENLPARKEPSAAFERVTTRSLEALDLYTRGVHAYLDQNDPNRRTKSEALFREALEIDPEFASAQLLLAWALAYQWVDRGEALETAMRRALPEMERAVQLSDLTSESERHFILGCYYDWKEDYEKAAVHYELVLDLAPDHHWAMNNLDRVNRFLGRDRSSARYWVKAAEARPNNFYAQQEAAAYRLGLVGRDAAGPFLAKARELLDRDPSTYLPAAYAPVLTIGIWDRWLENDLDGALAESKRIRDLLESSGLDKSELTWQAFQLGLQYLLLGRFEEARKLRAEFSFDFLFFNGSLALISGQKEVPTGEPPDEPLIWLRLDPSSRQRFEGTGGQPLPDGSRQLIQGKLALLDDRMEGVQLLEEGIQILENSQGHPSRLCISSLELADAYEKLGRLDQAVSLLESISGRRRFFCYGGAGTLWLQAQARLAQLYRLAGRVEDACRVEDELRILLSVADPDHPILQQLQAVPD